MNQKLPESTKLVQHVDWAMVVLVTVTPPGACCPLLCGELCLSFALDFRFLRFLSGSSKRRSEMSRGRASQEAHTEGLLRPFLGPLCFPSLMVVSKEVQSKSINRKKIIY